VHGGGKHAPATDSCIPYTLPESVQATCQERCLVVPHSHLCLCCLVVPAGNITLPLPCAAAHHQQARVVVCSLLLQHRHNNRVWRLVFSWTSQICGLSFVD
jgi:hypothetical protein